MTDKFKIIASQADRDINLVEATLLIAKDEYPQLDIENYLNQINQHVDSITYRLSEPDSAEHIITTLNDYLFNEQGFSGNFDDFYNPQNSLLNDVLDTKKGIPITLSILYIEIGKQLGLDLQGVSFPGHFLVRLNVTQGAVILDPFFGGISLDEDSLKSRILNTKHTSSNIDSDLEELLSPASNKAILIRVLSNLRDIYIENKDSEKTLQMTNKILLLSPDNAQEYLARGLMHKQLECFRAALSDYEQYMHLKTNSMYDENIREEIISLKNSVKYLH